jgi:hypothetical protein
MVRSCKVHTRRALVPRELELILALLGPGTTTLELAGLTSRGYDPLLLLLVKKDYEESP